MKRDTVVLVLTVIGQGLSWLADFLNGRRKERKR